MKVLKIKKMFFQIFAAAAFIFLSACAAPRAVLNSAEVTPHKKLKTGGALEANLATETSKSLYGGLENGIEALYNQVKGSSDTVPITAKELNDYVRAILAYSLDPVGVGTDFYMQYGLLPRFDIGYHRVGGVNVFGAGWQFFGPTRSGKTDIYPNRWSGSLSVQYSSQEYELPSVLGKLQSIFRYEFKRKDILVPVAFGKGLGQNSRYGNYGLGLVYNYTKVKYGSDLLKLVEKLDDGSTIPFEKLQGEKSISSYGGFFNVRLGYKHVFLISSFSTYWQDYGDFDIYGTEKISLGGWTFVPALGVELLF